MRSAQPGKDGRHDVGHRDGRLEDATTGQAGRMVQEQGHVQRSVDRSDLVAPGHAVAGQGHAADPGEHDRGLRPGVGLAREVAVGVEQGEDQNVQLGDLAVVQVDQMLCVGGAQVGARIAEGQRALGRSRVRRFREQGPEVDGVLGGRKFHRARIPRQRRTVQVHPEHAPLGLGPVLHGRPLDRGGERRAIGRMRRHVAPEGLEETLVERGGGRVVPLRAKHSHRSLQAVSVPVLLGASALEHVALAPTRVTVGERVREPDAGLAELIDRQRLLGARAGQLRRGRSRIRERGQVIRAQPCDRDQDQVLRRLPGTLVGAARQRESAGESEDHQASKRGAHVRPE